MSRLCLLRSIAIACCLVGCASQKSSPASSGGRGEAGRSGQAGESGAPAADGGDSAPAADGGNGAPAADGGRAGTAGRAGSGGTRASSAGAGGHPAANGGSYSATEPVDFGPNVLIFDAGMNDASIQSRIDAVFKKQETNQFGSDRYAYFFKPGKYNLDVQLGFYMEVLGLGAAPDDVSITGAVRSMAKWDQGNATQNFWRLAANLAVTPTAAINKSDVWAVSQATALRRFHVTAGINLFDPEGGPNEWASGGFIADSKIDGTVVPGSQQQFLTRNVTMQMWTGGVWNMVFVGNRGNPSGAWPASPYTFVDKTPTIREKPYLTIDDAGSYSVVVPALQSDTQGTSWEAGAAKSTTLPISRFYIAHADKDSADSLNAALTAGANLILTPGVYHLASSLEIARADTVVLGLGLATLTPDRGNAAIHVADVDGVTIAGVLFDAGAMTSDSLLELGDAPSAISHAADPSALFDVSCRIGGAAAGSSRRCVGIHSRDVIIDNAWLWRADHGSGVGWNVNTSANGLVVDAANVTAYGLFVEHFQAYQTLWSGEGGRVYFYQSEIPYDVPSQAAWMHDGANGYASFEVDAHVTKFDGRGLGIYCNFDNSVVLDNAIESPTASGVVFQHVVTQWFKNADGSAIEHIINGSGAAVNAQNSGATSAN
ncbi:MAG TPA: collagen-like protein [Polyangiales bacterium]|jgi:hypothetical protein